MSTRANIFIRNDFDDNEKVVIYHHRDANVSKEELASFICNNDSDFRIITPFEAADAEYIYEINLAKRSVKWEGLYNGEQEWLCNF